MARKRLTIEEEIAEQKRKEEEFQKELSRLMKEKDYSIQEDGSILTYENPTPAITEEQKIEDDWPEWRLQYYNNPLREGSCIFCTKNRKIKLENITSYTYIGEDGEHYESGQGEWECNYCPVCGKMLKQIRKKESFSNDYVLKQYLADRERKKKEREQKK